MAETTNIKISQIEVNKGQIEGLPKNPRFVKDDKFKKLVKSIEENPEMLGYRELLVYPHGGKYIVIGGNMRLRACKQLGYKEVPCKVLPQDTTIEQLKAYTIKDNSGFGEWDFDLLANEWDTELLDSWGVDLPVDDVCPDDFGEDFSLPEGDKAPFQQMSFTLADDQAEVVKQAIADAKHDESYKWMETFGNSNTNGNALYLIVSQWAEQRKL